MLCLIYTHSPSGAARPRASCVYIRQSTLACVITITYIYIYIYIYIYAVCIYLIVSMHDSVSIFNKVAI